MTFCKEEKCINYHYWMLSCTPEDGFLQLTSGEFDNENTTEKLLVCLFCNKHTNHNFYRKE